MLGIWDMWTYVVPEQIWFLKCYNYSLKKNCAIKKVLFPQTQTFKRDYKATFKYHILQYIFLAIYIHVYDETVLQNLLFLLIIFKIYKNTFKQLNMYLNTKMCFLLYSIFVL